MTDPELDDVYREVLSRYMKNQQLRWQKDLDEKFQMSTYRSDPVPVFFFMPIWGRTDSQFIESINRREAERLYAYAKRVGKFRCNNLALQKRKEDILKQNLSSKEQEIATKNALYNTLEASKHKVQEEKYKAEQNAKLQEKKAIEARRKEQEAKKREAEAKKKEARAKKKAEEAQKKEAQAKKRAEESKRRMEKAKREEEATKKQKREEATKARKKIEESVKREAAEKQKGEEQGKAHAADMQRQQDALREKEEEMRELEERERINQERRRQEEESEKEAERTREEEQYKQREREEESDKQREREEEQEKEEERERERSRKRDEFREDRITQICCRHYKEDGYSFVKYVSFYSVSKGDREMGYKDCSSDWVSSRTGLATDGSWDNSGNYLTEIFGGHTENNTGSFFKVIAGNGGEHLWKTGSATKNKDWSTDMWRSQQHWGFKADPGYHITEIMCNVVERNEQLVVGIDQEKIPDSCS